MTELTPKQSRQSTAIALLIYTATMAGFFAWLAFNGEDTMQRRLAETPSVTVTIAGKEPPAVPQSWKGTPEKEAAELMKDVEEADETKADTTVTEPATPDVQLEEQKPAEEAKPPEEKSPEEKPTETKPAETPASEAAEQKQAEPAQQTPQETPTPQKSEAVAETPASTSATPALPWQKYARPFDKSDASKPRIAIVVTDLGLASGATQAAVQELPGEISLAFSSAATDLEGWVAKARAAGHEAILTVPMEPNNYPQNDPGPNTLLTGLENKENVDRMRRALARTQGYVGVMPYMGEKFVTEESKMAPVMDVVKEQGLMVLDGTQNKDSVIAPLSRLGKIPFARSNVTIDLAASRTAIETQLADLEQVAKERGEAIGIALPYPVTLEKLKAWIPTLEQRGFVLVPLTAVAAENIPVVQATELVKSTDVQPAAMPAPTPSVAKSVTPDPNRINNELVE